MYNYDKWTDNSEAGERIIETYGEYEDNIDFWENLSARNFFAKVVSPIMVHHGTRDQSVPIEWSNDTVDFLEKAGQEVTYHIYENEPHEFATAWPLVMRRTTEFFDQYLK
jgi:dipeptidyl aminopeptidase/acylaminoacyl peptidase